MISRGYKIVAPRFSFCDHFVTTFYRSLVPVLSKLILITFSLLLKLTTFAFS